MQNVNDVKSLTDLAAEIVDRKARQNYGANCFGCSWNPGIKVHLEDGTDSSFAEQLLLDIDNPVVAEDGLDIFISVGSLIAENMSGGLSGDTYTVTADPTDTKYIKFCLMVNDTSGNLEVGVQEKVLGDYGGMPAGYTLAGYIKEYSVEAAGSSLTELNDWT